MRASRPAGSFTALASLTAGLAACGGVGTGPGNGSIEISVIADASVPGDAGFTLTLDGRDPRLLESAGRVIYERVVPGVHLVHLFGLPATCEVRGTNPLAVEVFGEGTAAVSFSVVCGPAESGGFDVEVSTVGEPLDDDGYQLSVAGAALRVIDINARESYTGLAPGIHLITLKDVIPECRVRGGNPQPFTVIAGRSVQVRLGVICGPPPEPH